MLTKEDKVWGFQRYLVQLFSEAHHKIVFGFSSFWGKLFHFESVTSSIFEWCNITSIKRQSTYQILHHTMFLQKSRILYSALCPREWGFHDYFSSGEESLSEFCHSCKYAGTWDGNISRRDLKCSCFVLEADLKKNTYRGCDREHLKTCDNFTNEMFGKSSIASERMKWFVDTIETKNGWDWVCDQQNPY